MITDPGRSHFASAVDEPGRLALDVSVDTDAGYGDSHNDNRIEATYVRFLRAPGEPRRTADRR